jgi:hypothetical protein
MLDLDSDLDKNDEIFWDLYLVMYQSEPAPTKVSMQVWMICDHQKHFFIVLSNT